MLRGRWGPVVGLALVAGVLPLPIASALSVEAGFEGDVFVVSLRTDEPTGPLDLVVLHAEPRGSVVDGRVSFDLAAGEEWRYVFEGLPPRVYETRIVPRGQEIEDAVPPATPAPTSPPTTPPSPSAHPSAPLAAPFTDLRSLARDGNVPVWLSRALPPTSYYPARLSLGAPGDPMFMVRESPEGAIEVARSDDEGLTWTSPETFADAAPGGSGWTYWTTTRFSDGALGVLWKQAQPMMPGASPWRLTRYDAAGERILSSLDVKLPSGETIPTTDRLDLLVMPDSRVLLFGQTFARDPRPEELLQPAVLKVWRLTMDGEVHDEVQIPIPHGISPSFRALLADDGTIHVVWSHSGLDTPDAKKLWRTRSTDGGRTFEPATAIDVPFAGGDDVRLSDAAVTGDGTLLVTADAELPDGSVHWIPFVVRVPRPETGAPATQLDMRTIMTLRDRPGYSHVGVLAHGDLAWLHFYTDDGTRLVESLDGGATFDALVRLTHEGAGFGAIDVALQGGGVPVFSSWEDACRGCFAGLGDLDAILDHVAPRLVPSPFAVPPPPSFPPTPFPPLEPRVITSPQQPSSIPAPAIVLVLGALALSALVRRRAR